MVAQTVGNVDDPKAVEIDVQTVPKKLPMTALTNYDKGYGKRLTRSAVCHISRTSNRLKANRELTDVIKPA